MPVERDVLVDLVGDREEVVLPAKLRDERQLGAVEDLAGGVLGRVDHESLHRGVRGGRPQLFPVEPPSPRLRILAQGHEPRHEAEDRGLRRVELVVGLHHDDPVARLQQRPERDRHPFARPEHHRDLLLGVGTNAVERFGVVRDRAAQLRDPERERVLVELVPRVADGGEELPQGEVERVAARPLPARAQDLAHRHGFEPAHPLLGPAHHRGDPAPHHVEHRRLVGEPLREVDRAVLHGEPGHPANDGFLDFHPLPPSCIAFIRPECSIVTAWSAWKSPSPTGPDGSRTRRSSRGWRGTMSRTGCAGRGARAASSGCSST